MNKIGILMLLIAVLLALPIYFVNTTKLDIQSLQIAPEVFATLLVSSSIISFEYAHFIKESVEKLLIKGLEKYDDLFSIIFSISIVSSLSGLFASVISGKGLWILFYLLISVGSIFLATTIITLMYVASSKELLYRKMPKNSKNKQ